MQVIHSEAATILRMRRSQSYSVTVGVHHDEVIGFSSHFFTLGASLIFYGKDQMAFIDNNMKSLGPLSKYPHTLTQAIEYSSMWLFKVNLLTLAYHSFPSPSPISQLTLTSDYVVYWLSFNCTQLLIFKYEWS